MTLNTSPVKRRQSVKRRTALEAAPDGDAARVPRRRRGLRILVPAAIALAVVGLFAWLQWRTSGQSQAPTQGFVTVNRFPHDPKAYCQGLVFRDGFLYEGTGNYGESSLRKVELQTGRVLQRHNLDAHLFGEGIALWENQIIQLTWKSRQAIVYDLASFQEQRRFAYKGQGWGLTHDGQFLIMSDGTATLRFIDPKTFEVKRQLLVRDGSRRINQLNELEYVEGEIYANVWYDDRIARISPTSGRVLAWIDLSRLYPAAQRPHRDAVLNGIAYDAKSHRLFVTGKDWPRLFEIRVSD